MQYINDLMEESYRQSLGYDLEQNSGSESAQSRLESLKQAERLDRVWMELSEMYGSQLSNQWGQTMPDAWMRLLREFSSIDLQRGLEGVIKREGGYAPNAKEFRDLCLKNSRSHAKNHTAYIDFNDPDHPNYEPPRIESDDMKATREATGRAALDQMKGMF